MSLSREDGTSVDISAHTGFIEITLPNESSSHLGRYKNLVVLFHAALTFEQH
jgi:hypothetical protein